MFACALLYTFVHCEQKKNEGWKGICSIFLVDKCLPLRYNTPIIPREVKVMTGCFHESNSKASAALRLDVRLDAAIILVVSVCAVLVRIMGLWA